MNEGHHATQLPDADVPKLDMQVIGVRPTMGQSTCGCKCGMNKKESMWTERPTKAVYNQSRPCS